MPDYKLRLVYPPALVNVPIIYQLIRHYELSVNILRAQVSEESGWIDIHISANPVVYEDALGWLRSQGVEVRILET